MLEYEEMDNNKMLDGTATIKVIGVGGAEILHVCVPGEPVVINIPVTSIFFT